jgi:hypothetical protein
MGRHPRMGFEPHQRPLKVKAINKFAERMKSTLDEARAALAKSKENCSGSLSATFSMVALVLHSLRLYIVLHHSHALAEMGTMATGAPC